MTGGIVLFLEPRDRGMIPAIRATRRIATFVPVPDRGIGGRRLRTVTGSPGLQRVEGRFVVAPEGWGPILMTP